jgi:hypothetical protein
MLPAEPLVKCLAAAHDRGLKDRPPSSQTAIKVHDAMSTATHENDRDLAVVIAACLDWTSSLAWSHGEGLGASWARAYEASTQSDDDAGVLLVLLRVLLRVLCACEAMQGLATGCPRRAACWELEATEGDRRAPDGCVLQRLLRQHVQVGLGSSAGRGHREGVGG